MNKSIRVVKGAQREATPAVGEARTAGASKSTDIYHTEKIWKLLTTRRLPHTDNLSM